MQKELSAAAKHIIHEYLNLQIGSAVCSAPYFNNRTTGIRGGLSVHVGKGTPKEIIEEAELIAKKNHIDMQTLDSEKAKRLLVENKLGIECSGFAYHVLNAEVKEQTGKPFATSIEFPLIHNVIKKLLAKHTPVTRAGTKTLAHDANSSEVPLADIQAGDMIIILGYGANKDRDHVMLVEKVENKANTIVVQYVHSLAWQSDGKYDHGVRRGIVTIADTTKPLTEATWEEQSAKNATNQTWQNAKDAKYLSIRRLHALSTQ